MLRLMLVILLLTAACGDEDDNGYSGPCEEAVKPEIQAQIDQALIDNMAARDAAVAAEQARMAVVPLRPTTILGLSSVQGVFKPETDPFPKSIVASGDLAFDIRASGYAMNHGDMGQENIYETEPGSGEFFIVDMIDGDGVGSNSWVVQSADIEYGLSEVAPAGLDGFSFHSWQVSEDNVIVRAKQRPDDIILGEVAICGCGPLYEVEANLALDSASKAPAEMKAMNMAVFMLPGKVKPQVSTEPFEAKFKRSYFKQKYVPRKGHHCRYNNSNTVC